MTEFNISVIVVAKMITYKFLILRAGVLLRIRDRSADGAFHLAILALHETRQTLIVFARSRQSYRLVSQNLLLYKFYYGKISLKCYHVTDSFLIRF